jgi:hypothetical protein
MRLGLNAGGRLALAVLPPLAAASRSPSER